MESSKNNMTTKTFRNLAVMGLATLIGMTVLTGCSRNKAEPRYTPYNAPRAHSTIGEDVVDADGDGKVDFVVDALSKDSCHIVKLFAKGYNQKARELGYVLLPNAREMTPNEMITGQGLFESSRHFKEVRGASQ
jgi:hypothetical protein